MVSRLSSSAQVSSLLPLEEEQLSNYDPQKYYPAQIGESIGKYRILSKLGWGVSSTAWLAKDMSRWPWQKTRYVTLKLTNCGPQEKRAAEEEVAISQHIASSCFDHKGLRYIRLVQESFQVQGRFGQHICLVFEPLREPIWRLGRHLGGVGVPIDVLKPFLRILLQGLDFLHSECHIIHTDLKADNLLIGFEDPAVIRDYVRQQSLDPAPWLLKIADFSAAVFGNVPIMHNHDIQPQPFCAPEVLLNAGWTYSADIWNLGAMLWELLAGTYLFDGRCGAGAGAGAEYSRERHVAQMIGLLGKPPSEFLDRCKPSIRSSMFSSQGDFIPTHLIPPADFNFQNLTPFVSDEEKNLFIAFALRMLRWDPESRATARELLQDDWLQF
ncbi:hypothetical protein P175DRAFT_0561003 [Aspergillus ochraceoroseus IBT 24754]|uniref:non-specific serine/threonine protein kinase n=2 Tax=Aspergillus ochraceoroseus TaxID=138278 RepID=A0A2T5LM13_9EURO|nr:uncharacterized protein P175DRAFT_0561003 [Aspergillus ochraceoroseus IBT 24754]KKK14683.1 hypothetical protein AOCH_000805 [Aspergillus ochraceoroseus]PTU17320.1 hypothetical protein P175DRAFT_0561003 [Aspergillus ochraceoroseus IBT 24754]